MTRPPRFHTKPIRRRAPPNRRFLSRLLPFLWLALILAAGWWLASLNSSGGVWEAQRAAFPVCGTAHSSAGCVIDGDTIAIGHRPNGRKIRMAGYNAPELAGRCPAESALAIRAQQALSAWLSAGPFEMDGGADPPFDQYGRELRSFRRTGADGREEWLADHMEEAGLAQTGWSADRAGWCG